MDTLTKKIETLISELPDVDSLFTLVGGGVYGRTTVESSNRADIKVLLDKKENAIAVDKWIKLANEAIAKEELAGVKVIIRNQGIRGIRVSQGEDDLNLRIKGPNLTVLESLADQAVEALNGTSGIRNVQHSSEGSDQELTIKVDRERAAQLGLSTEEIGNVIRFAEVVEPLPTLSRMIRALMWCSGSIEASCATLMIWARSFFLPIRNRANPFDWLKLQILNGKKPQRA